MSVCMNAMRLFVPVDGLVDVVRSDAAPRGRGERASFRDARGRRSFFCRSTVPQQCRVAGGGSEGINVYHVVHENR